MNLRELIPGAGECKALCKALWPEEWEQVKTLPMGSAVRQWLNEKTGLDVPGTAAAHFHHWLPRLRELASERGVSVT